MNDPFADLYPAPDFSNVVGGGPGDVAPTPSNLFADLYPAPDFNRVSSGAQSSANSPSDKPAQGGIDWRKLYALSNPLAVPFAIPAVSDFHKIADAGVVSGAGSALAGVERMVSDQWHDLKDQFSPIGALLESAKAPGPAIAKDAALTSAMDELRESVRPDGTSAVSDALLSAGETIKSTASPELLQAMENSRFEGDALSPSTWGVSDDASLLGFAGNLTETGGQMLPVVGAGMVNPVAGLAVASGQSAEGAYKEAADYLKNLPVEQFAEIPRFKELVSKGVPIENAHQIVIDEAGSGAMYPAAAVGSLSGPILGGTVTRPLAAILEKRFGQGFLSRLYGNLAEVPLEGAQEGFESAAGRAGANTASGDDRSLTEGTFGDVVMGGLAAAPTAVAQSIGQIAAESSEDRIRKLADVVLGDREVTPESNAVEAGRNAAAAIFGDAGISNDTGQPIPDPRTIDFTQAVDPETGLPPVGVAPESMGDLDQQLAGLAPAPVAPTESAPIDREALLADLAEPELIRSGSRVFYRGDVPSMRARLAEAGLSEGMRKTNEDGTDAGLYFPARMQAEVDAVLRPNAGQAPVQVDAVADSAPETAAPMEVEQSPNIGTGIETKSNRNGEYLSVSNGEGTPEVRVSHSNTGVYSRLIFDSGKRSDTVLNKNGDFVDAKEIIRNANEFTGAENVAWTGSPESRQFIVEQKALSESLSDDYYRERMQIIKDLVTGQIDLAEASKRAAELGADKQEAPVASPAGNQDRVEAIPEVTEAEASQIEAPTESRTEGSILEVPIDSLTLSDDVPQFKSGARSDGVVEPLGGTFDRRGTGPIQIWRRKDGRMEVVSGRHRLDLARRSGEKTIPAQVYNESDGFDAQQAASLDAELNIRDGQGKVKDYVQYFAQPAFDGPSGKQAADARGLLARATGKRAYSIASQGSPELIAAHSADRVTDEAAVQIAQAAPQNAPLQALGMKLVQEGKSIGIAANTMRAVRSMQGDRPQTSGDMFGFDDSAIQDAVKMAGVASRRQREIAERLAAITGASKRPEIAAKEGVDVRDPQALPARIAQLRAEKAEWDDWATDPAKVAAIRAELGMPEQVQQQAAEETTEDAQPVDDVTAPMFSRGLRPRSEMESAPVGAWIDGGNVPGIGPTAFQVRDVPLDKISPVELDSVGDVGPEKRSDVGRYTEAMRRGEQFPNARGYELENGKINLVDGHRRLLAAKAAGKTSLRIAVNPLDDSAKSAMFSRRTGGASGDMFGGATIEDTNRASPRSRMPEAADLFGGPSMQERVGAAERARDAARNSGDGKRADTGDGGLFDGPRPEQAILRSQRKQEDEDQRPDKPTDEGIESNEITGDDADALIADMRARQQRKLDEAADPLTEGFKILGANPETFRTKLLPGKTVRELAKQSGANYAGQSNEDGIAVHSVAVEQGDAGPAMAKIYDDGNDVWIDVSGLKSGGGKGDSVYNMAYSYARNNGRNFKEDPAGVSDTAMYRRPVQQLSALLKSGDADNIAPGDFLATQRPGGPNTRPIKAPANRAFDPTLRENILTTYTNALNAVPEIGEIRYDTNSAAFVDASGKPVTDAEFDRLASNRRANPIREAMVRVGDPETGQRLEPAPVGGNSLKVAVLAQTLLGASPSQRPALLDGLRKIAAGSLGDSGLSRILPSKRTTGSSPFAGMTRDEFLGKPTVTRDSNASDLKPSALVSVRDAEPVAFPSRSGNYSARYSEDGAAVYDGDKVIASYNFGDTLVVAKQHRREGLGTELVYQWRTRYPAPSTARARTKAAQAVQERVWDRIQRDASQSDDAPTLKSQSSAEPARRELTRAEIDADVKRVFGTAKPLTRLINSGAVSLITKAQAIQRGLGSAKSLEGVKGLHDGTRGYLITDELQPNEVAGVLIHEIGVHHSMERILGAERFDKLQKAMESFRARGDKDVLAAYAAVPKDTPAHHVNHEAIAYLAEHSANHSITQKLVDATKLFLNRLGVPMSWIKAEPAAVRSIARESLLAESRRGNGSVRYNGRDTLYQKVWHGTPHRDIEKTGFSLQKIGTGEGAQAYGWGMYFAGNKEIAEHYRQTLTKRDEVDFWTDDLRAKLAPSLSRVEVQELGDLGNDMFRNGNLQGESLARWRELKDKQTAYDESVERYRPRGNLYRVEIPEDSDLLDWDKPLSEQPEKVRKALNSLIDALGIRDQRASWEQKLDRDTGQLPRADVGNGSTGKEIYEAIAKKNVKPQPAPGWTSVSADTDAHNWSGHRAASHALHEAGIPGLRYLDGTSRNKGEGSANYVIWDETLLTPEKAQITPYYSKRTDDEDQTQTAAFKRWFGDSKVVDADGKPLRVYHGTASDIETPNTMIWGSETPKLAGEYAAMRDGEKGGGGNITPVFMNIKQPFDANLGISKSPTVADFINAIARQARDAGVEITKGMDAKILGLRKRINDGRAEEESGPHYSTHDFWHNTNSMFGQDGAKAIRELFDTLGFDGVRLIEGGETTYGAFKPEQIKSATGNNGQFDPGNPNILKSRRTPSDAQKDAAARRAVAVNTLGGPTTGGAIGWNFDAGEWEGKSGTARRARAALDDKMIAWRDVQDSIAEHLGKTIPDAQNVYRLENLMHGRVKEGIDDLEHKMVEPLVRAMKERGITTEALEEYLYALHAKERNDYIASINPKMPDGGSGMTNAEADVILAKPLPLGMKEIAKRAKAIIRQTRKRLLDHGIITQDQFDAMESQYQNYVPLRGKTVGENEFDSGGSGAGRGIDGRPSPVKQAFGRGAGNRAENILGEIIGDAQRSIIAAEKARVGRAVMRIVLANPNPKLWTVEPVLTERKLDSTGEVYDAVVNDWSDPSIIAVRHRGKVYKVQINHAPLAKALNLVGVDQIGAVTRAAGALNRYFSAVLTRYNPAFIPVNAARDALFGLTGLAVEHGEVTAMKAALYYPKAIRAAWREARRLPPKSQADTYAREFSEDGGKTGYVSMPSVEELQRKIGSGRFGGYSPQGIGRAAQAVGDLVGAMNDSVENALRLSAYVTLREQGMAREKAASYAKELTVNFNRKGSEGTKLNSWFLFYNASMQGIKRTGALMKSPKTWGYLGALTAAQIAAVMYAMGQEDDDGTPIWDKVPDHVKQRNLVFTWLDDGGEQKILTIPMPYGLNVFPYFAGRVADGMMHAENRPRDRAISIAADTVSTAVQSFSPVPLDDGAMGLLPTALRIPLSIQVNRDDFGRQIRKENPFGKFDVPRASIGKPDTLEMFKVMATGLNRIGGGDERTPPPMSAFDVAPEDIEYVLEKLGGGTGKFIIDMATVGQKATGELPVEARDIPIAKRFFTNVNEPAAQQAMFYERREAIERDADMVRDVYEKDGPEAAIALLRSTPSLSGADFRRYKESDPKKGHRKGGIVVVDGRPQLVVRRPDSVYGRYKAAAEETAEVNGAMRNAYADSPMSLRPSGERDKRLKELADKRMAAQRIFNAAWNRDVVGGE